MWEQLCEMLRAEEVEVAVASTRTVSITVSTQSGSIASATSSHYYRQDIG